MTPLRVVRPEPTAAPPPDRGRLLTATEVATEFFGNPRKAPWVRRNVPHKVALGHSTVRWFEADVQAWLETQREP